jgi:hypothetical protein
MGELPAIYAPNQPDLWTACPLPAWAQERIEQEAWDAVLSSALRGWGGDARETFSVTIKADDGRVVVGMWGVDQDTLLRDAIDRVQGHISRRLT